MSPKEKQTYAAIGLFGALILYAYWAFLWKPLSARIQQRREEVHTMESQINEAVNRSQKLSKLFKEVLALRLEVEEISKQIPQNRELPGLIRIFARQAQSFGLEMTTFSPGVASKKGLYDEIPYAVTLRTDFHSLGRFMTAIGKGKRILAFRNLAATYSGNADPAKSISATVTMVAFRFNG